VNDREKPSFGERLRMMLPEFGIRHPWLSIALIAVMAAGFMAQFPKVKFDNDPENMLDNNEAVRVFHREVKARYALFDFVIVGVVNDTDPDGIFNVETLSRIHRLTGELMSLQRDPEGLPRVISRDGEGPETVRTLDLRPSGGWKRLLAAAFRHDPNRLFTKDGESALIARELIAPSVVDNIKQAGLGSLKIEYLMENPPRTREEAQSIRRDAMDNPLYNGTLVAEDGRAICLYIPLADKTYSYNAARLVEALTADWKGADKVYITGQPVAQDTFGVEMLVQMATSAPLAGLVIFLLLLFFFRRVQLILAPMIIAVLSVIAAMGLLIGLGYDVHIMSSMIAIFLMPIAVADSVHILSEFFDTYHKFNDKGRTIRSVMSHLFQPMLYTSLTTIAGFASLATTPIPPVKVFGLHVAFGVTLAWVLTMVLAPAYIMVAVSKKTLEKMAKQKADQLDKPSAGSLDHYLEKLGRFSVEKGKLIIGLVVLVTIFSVIGVAKIKVNDNPIKWFVESHDIRKADRELNAHFGGTYTAYLTFAPTEVAESVPSLAARLKAAVNESFGAGAGRDAFGAAVDKAAASSGTADAFFGTVAGEAARLDETALAGWDKLADALNYLDAESLTPAGLKSALAAKPELDAAAVRDLTAALAVKGELKGEALREAALAVCDARTGLSYQSFVRAKQTDWTAPVFKRPDMLRWLLGLQRHLMLNPVVGKASSAADALVKASYELNYVEPDPAASEPEKAKQAEANAVHRAVPPTAAGVGQVFTQLEGMKRKDTLFHMVTRDYQEANVWVQLKSGDNVDMESVVKDVDAYIAGNPPPAPLRTGWAGLTYLNVVWQAKMVRGMFSSLASSFVMVLLMMVVLFRSPLFGLLSMIPLSVTILFTYGLIGWAGKDYDMPIAVLSSLTLGLSVDFAIHFLERAREEVKKLGSWDKAVVVMFKEPAAAISRNAITVAVGFLPLLAAPLVPYRTVGVFLALIMIISWLATLFILPPLLAFFRRRAFSEKTESKGA
jgi:predicted RND superfamily exporter protein